MAFGLGVARGMLTTISHLVKRPVTIQYPEERMTCRSGRAVGRA